MLCVFSSNKVVNIYNRHGEHKVDVLIVLPGYVHTHRHTRACKYVSLHDSPSPPSLRLCTSLDWDKDGDALAVAQDMNGASASLESIYTSSYIALSAVFYRDPLSLEFPQL